MTNIEIHQKDASGDGVFLIWYRDRFSELHCETKTDDDLCDILTPAQWKQFVNGTRYEFNVSGSHLRRC